MKKSAFTLIEIIIGITILTILAVIAYLSYSNYTINARDAKRVSDIRAILSKIEVLRTDSVPYAELINSSKTNDIKINNENKTSKQGTVNFERLGENKANFQDPLGNFDYQIAYAIGIINTAGANTTYDFNQIATINEKEKTAVVMGNYLPIDILNDSPSILTSTFGNTSLQVINGEDTFPYNPFGEESGKEEEPIIENNMKIYHNLSYGESERQIMDLYLPTANGVTEIKYNVGLAIHGGGWYDGDKSSNFPLVKPLAEYNNVIGATMNYRYLSNTTSLEDMMNDITSAIQKIKSMASKEGIVLNKIFLYGGTEGGYLALQYAYKYQNISPIPIGFVATVSAPVDFTDIPSMYTSINKDYWMFEIVSMLIGQKITHDNYISYENELKSISPAYLVNSSTPPTIIEHGMLDDFTPYENATILESALTNAGVQHILFSLPNSAHLDLPVAADVSINEAFYTKIYEYIYSTLMN